jgi:L-asparagine oxygenase
MTLPAEIVANGYFVTDRVPERSLLEISNALGLIRADARSPEPVRDIRPQLAAEAKENTLSSRYGTGSFPFHTDVAHWPRPARFLLLYCRNPGSGARPTHLQDSKSWMWDKDTEQAATTEVWKVGLARPYLSTMATVSPKGLKIRFDDACMTPMTIGAKALHERIASSIKSTNIIDIYWSSQKLLIIDNHRMIHARGKPTAPDPDRVLSRILVGGADD